MTYEEICEKVQEAKTKLEALGTKPDTVILSLKTFAELMAGNPITMFGLDVNVGDLSDGVGFLVTKKVHTNKDWIRSMTTDELAELIGDNIDCCVCEHIACGRPCHDGKVCYDFWKEWLGWESV